MPPAIAIQSISKQMRVFYSIESAYLEFGYDDLFVENRRMVVKTLEYGLFQYSNDYLLPECEE